MIESAPTLVNVSLITSAVYDRRDLMVSMTSDLLVSDCILDLTGVSSANFVIDSRRGWLSISESCGSAVASGGSMRGVVLVTLVVAAKSV